MDTVEVDTHARDQMLDITSQIQRVVSAKGAAEGLAVVFVPHTTAGVTINEGADPAVAHDMLLMLDERIPRDHPEYRHLEGNSASHIKASLIGSSVTIPVRSGRLALGTWQAIFLCEFDGPRRRRVEVRITAG